MKELVEVIAKALVDHPEGVIVTETVHSKSVVLELKVDPEDMGKVIGKNCQSDSYRCKICRIKG